MKKLKVLKAFFDKVEDKYVYPDKEPEIEREEKRAEQLVQVGVCELVEEGQDNDGSNGQLPPATTPEDGGAKVKSDDDGAQASPEGSNENPESPKAPEDGSNGQPNKKDKKANPETK